MGEIARLLVLLFTNVSANRIRAAAWRAAWAPACLFLAGTLAVAAIVCVLAALWTALLPAVGPIGAPLVTAVAAAVLVVPLALGARSTLTVRRHPLFGDLAPELARAGADLPLPLVIAAFVVGLIAGHQVKR